jgi:hypothetical protein
MADRFLALSKDDRREALKAYGAIRRFSEDSGLTYDIRALALVGDNDEALSKTRSEEKRWTSEVRKRFLSGWPSRWSRSSQWQCAINPFPARIRIEGDTLYLDYEA